MTNAQPDINDASIEYQNAILDLVVARHIGPEEAKAGTERFIAAAKSLNSIIVKANEPKSSFSRKVTNDNQPDDERPRKKIYATQFELPDPTSLPERDWLYGKHYIRKYATASVGSGGGGKTAHSISEALAMVSGRPLLDPDGPLTKPLRVWWINAEDPQEEINRRIAAAAKHFGVTKEQIGGRLFTDPGRDQDFIIARTNGKDKVK